MVRHVPGEDLPWQVADGTRFTGRVETARLASGEGEAAATVAVRFAARARTYWHSHAAGQVLWVLSGTAVVATDEGGVSLASAGDVVVSPPGELHWHGAGNDASMLHVSITADDGAAWTSREVDEEQYRQATG